MIRHIWSVLCSQSVIDIETNNISLFNVVEQLAVTVPRKNASEGVPIAQLPLEIVSLWERTGDGPTGVTTVVDVLDASGERIGGAERRLDISSARRCRSRLAFNSLPITGSGRYVVRVSLQAEDGEQAVVAELPLEVAIVESSN